MLIIKLFIAFIILLVILMEIMLYITWGNDDEKKDN